MKKHFITFGGPNSGWHNRVKQICDQANELQIFDNIIGVTDINLKNDTIFWNTHGNFIENNPRGYGYWIWKSYLILQNLEEMNDGDIILYCDAGCEINKKGINRLNEYFDMVSNSESGMLSFYLNDSEYPNFYNEHNLTKNDIFLSLNCSEEIINSNHCISGIFLIKKCDNTMNFAKQFYETCCNYNLINDFIGNSPNHPTFKECRHDQSIFSCLSKMYKSIAIYDETYFNDWKDGEFFPILAKRIRG